MSTRPAWHQAKAKAKAKTRQCETEVEPKPKISEAGGEATMYEAEARYFRNKIILESVQCYL